MKANFPLLALAVGAFAIGVTEFAPMGMLPVIAEGIGVSIPSAGLLISAYALGVTLGAPVITLLTTRMPRRTLLIGLAALFVLGNSLSALAPDYSTLIAARVVAALCQGTFFGTGAIVSGTLVAPGRQASAVASMFMGLTVANVVGVPLATWIGQQFGWRAAFGGITALGVVTMAALAASLRREPAPDGGTPIAELRVLAGPHVLAALGLTALVSSSQFAVFTYMSAALRDVGQASVGFVTAMLTTYGLGMCVGAWLGGRWSDRSVNRTMVVSLSAVAVLLGCLSLSLGHPLLTAPLIFLWGIASFAMIPALQVRVMGAAGDAPNLASAMNIGAFNLGNAGGAAFGGAILSGGFGYPAVMQGGAAIAVAALAVIIVGFRRSKNAERA